MNFLAPAAFALAVLLPIIVAMYLLKLRRTEQTVSSVYLWRRMVRDVEANAPWQRLRRNLLLLLQLLFVIALLLALARPFTWAEGLGGRAAVFVVDTSASMAATDLQPSRLAAAKQQMRHLVDGLPNGAQTTVIAAGADVQVLVSSSRDRQQIDSAIDSIQVETGRGNLPAALELASAIAARQPDAEIVVLSDFAGTDAEVRLSTPAPVRTLTLGNSDDNQAISTLTLQPFEGSGPPDGSAMTAFVQVANYGSEPAQRRLVLSVDVPTTGESVTVAAYDLEIPPRGQEVVINEDLPPDVRVLEARLDGEDTLPLDDRAWTVYRDAETVGVTLVSAGNRFLETALALLPGLEVTTVRPEDYETGNVADGRLEDGRLEDSEGQASSLTIFDAYVPITATQPAGSVLYIAPPRSTDLFTVTGTLDQPAPAPADRTDPLLAHVDLGEVSVLRAARIPLPDWARAVAVDGANGGEWPLLLAGEANGQRIAVLAFDLRDSDLPLQVAFPLLLANLTTWLAPGSAGQLPTQVEAGTSVALSLPRHVEALTVTRPDGASSRLVPESGRAVFAGTGQLGVYRVAWGDAGQGQFAVNLNRPQESNVAPGDPGGVAGSGAEPGSAAAPQQAHREWWRPLGFLALALLVTEWMVYQRGAVARLRDRVMPRLQ